MEIFNSLDTTFRCPVGAVKEGQNIHFKIFLSKLLQCSCAKLILIDEFTNSTKYFSMFWCGDLPNNFEMWECDFSPEHIGLYWYQFELICNGQKRIIYKGKLKKGELSEVLSSDKSFPSWQITVYKKDFDVPSWLSGGIMYQIFPDRFYCSKIINENVPYDRLIHTNWNELPLWKPNKNGHVTNSDYFGGNLHGIIQKLDYLKELKVTCLYLNPIFEAHSNHRYNTANYENIDPLLGTANDFKELCSQAKKRNIRIILDGVFSHTGSDSIYFNKEKRYKSIGAFNSKNSPYFSWYKFNLWPDKYTSWWGFNTLPEVNEMDSNYIEYITGESGIIQKWLNLGASGWRLDVADELPDEFIKKLKKSAKKVKDDSIIIGEVWEDASSKISYYKRRKYLLGDSLDSVMNYPFRDAIINFIKDGNSENFLDIVLSIIENYPKPVLNSLMNILGTHDTPRILTEIAGENISDKNIQAKSFLPKEQKEKAIKLLKIATAIQYTLPGVPCIYYADETAMEGYRDPFCRKTFPWGDINDDLLEFYKNMGEFRENCPALKDGEFKIINFQQHFIAYSRENKESLILCLFNTSKTSITINIPDNIKSCCNLIGDSYIEEEKITIKDESFAILKAFI